MDQPVIQPDAHDNTLFSSEASAVLRKLQSSVIDLLFGAGLDDARSTQVGRALGLDKTLAWKVTRFARETDPLGAARHLPGSAGFKIFLDAAETFGAPTDRIRTVSKAQDDFRRFVEDQAGDLRTYEAMLVGSRRDSKSDLEQRRSYYQSAAAIWGVRVSSQFLMLALCPTKRDDGMLDVVQASGFVRLERLKPDTPWIVRRLLTTTDDGGERLNFVREPLEPAGATSLGTLPLLREFCSDPLPQIHQFEGTDGVIYDEVLPGPLGPGGAVTVVSGELYRAALPSIRSDENQIGRYKLAVRTPAKYVLLDMLIHRELEHFGPMSMSIAGLLEGRPTSTALSNAENSEPARQLGSPPVLKTARLPEYEHVIARALTLAGRTPDEFCGYRAAIEYPTAPCEIALTCEIR